MPSTQRQGLAESLQLQSPDGEGLYAIARRVSGHFPALHPTGLSFSRQSFAQLLIFFIHQVHLCQKVINSFQHRFRRHTHQPPGTEGKYTRYGAQHQRHDRFPVREHSIHLHGAEGDSTLLAAARLRLEVNFAFKPHIRIDACRNARYHRAALMVRAEEQASSFRHLFHPDESR